jgi:hypothetical protein
MGGRAGGRAGGPVVIRQAGSPFKHTTKTFLAVV